MESQLVKNSKVGNELASLCKELEKLPTNMRLFSLALRSLYAENAVSSDTDVAKKFKKLRDDTRKDAMIYVKVILPVSTEVVRSLNEFFEYYGELDFDDWCSNLEDIIEDVKSFKSCCKEVVKFHKDIMVPYTMVILLMVSKYFIDGLNAAAGFFSVIENELNSIQGKAEKGAESPKKLHYTMMKNKANDMKGYCQGFYAMIPQVRTDFEAINFEIGDKNYVDEWLVKKKKEINEKYRSNLKGSLKKMVQLMTGHY